MEDLKKKVAAELKAMQEKTDPELHRKIVEQENKSDKYWQDALVDQEMKRAGITKGKPTAKSLKQSI